MITSMYYGARKETFQFAAQLRKNLTPAEKTLWEELRNNQFGVRFKCQHPISKYVVDFYCHSMRFVVEVDGSIHLIQEIHDNDEWREADLRNFGLKVIRFSNDMVLYNMEYVKDQIIKIMIERVPVAPPFHDLIYNDNDQYSVNSFDQP